MTPASGLWAFLLSGPTGAAAAELPRCSEAVRGGSAPAGLRAQTCTDLLLTMDDLLELLLFRMIYYGLLGSIMIYYGLL